MFTIHTGMYSNKNKNMRSNHTEGILCPYYLAGDLRLLRNVFQTTACSASIRTLIFLYLGKLVQ